MMRTFILACSLTLISGWGWAQGFPSKPITIIVGVAPGGTLDALARQVAQGLAPVLKQSVVVENTSALLGVGQCGHIQHTSNHYYEEASEKQTWIHFFLFVF